MKQKHFTLCIQDQLADLGEIIQICFFKVLDIHAAAGTVALSREVGAVQNAGELFIRDFGEDSSGGVGGDFVRREEKTQTGLTKVPLLIFTEITVKVCCDSFLVVVVQLCIVFNSEKGFQYQRYYGLRPGITCKDVRQIQCLTRDQIIVGSQIGNIRTVATGERKITAVNTENAVIHAHGAIGDLALIRFFPKERICVVFFACARSASAVVAVLLMRFRKSTITALATSGSGTIKEILWWIY